MQKSKHTHSRLNIGFLLGAALIAVAVVGLAYYASGGSLAKELATPTLRSDTSDDVDLQEIAVTTDPEALEYPKVVPESISVAEVDLTGDQKNDVKVVVYQVDVGAFTQTTRSAFRVYDMTGRLLYEDESSVWSLTPTRWDSGSVRQSDLDRNGDPELLMSGTVYGTGAYLNQKVFDLGSHVGFVEIPVVAAKSKDELTQMYLQSGEGLSPVTINPAGEGSRQISKPGKYVSRQTFPDPAGKLMHTYIYDRAQGFVEVNYQRIDY